MKSEIDDVQRARTAVDCRRESERLRAALEEVLQELALLAPRAGKRVRPELRGSHRAKKVEPRTKARNREIGKA